MRNTPKSLQVITRLQELVNQMKTKSVPQQSVAMSTMTQLIQRWYPTKWQSPSRRLLLSNWDRTKQKSPAWFSARNATRWWLARLPWCLVATPTCVVALFVVWGDGFAVCAYLFCNSHFKDAEHRCPECKNFLGFCTAKERRKQKKVFS